MATKILDDGASPRMKADTRIDDLLDHATAIATLLSCDTNGQQYQSSAAAAIESMLLELRELIESRDLLATTAQEANHA